MIVIADDADLLEQADVPLPLVPGVPEWLSPLVAVVPGQLAAIRLARLRGSDLDRPLGLSKVTLTPLDCVRKRLRCLRSAGSIFAIAAASASSPPRRRGGNRAGQLEHERAVGLQLLGRLRLQQLHGSSTGAPRASRLRPCRSTW